MLAMGIVQEVKRLLAEGMLSQRKIAKAVGVSRGTISAIAAGRRPDYAARRRERANAMELLGPIDRCPTCGGRVYMPCRLCRVRRVQVGEATVLQELRRRARVQAVKRLLAAVLCVATNDANFPNPEHAFPPAEPAA